MLLHDPTKEYNTVGENKALSALYVNNVTFGDQLLNKGFGLWQLGLLKT